jgi:hypothetical protein
VLKLFDRCSTTAREPFSSFSAFSGFFEVAVAQVNRLFLTSLSRPKAEEAQYDRLKEPRKSAPPPGMSLSRIEVVERLMRGLPLKDENDRIVHLSGQTHCGVAQGQGRQLWAQARTQGAE